MEDSEFARHLWQASSLETVFADIWLGPRRAVGLNANIRLYRYNSCAWYAGLTLVVGEQYQVGQHCAK